jgi:benzoyl-CoA reductase/2-hydroxyglutaryl-CoA dehydratase subunit BcrC/BadD/HgdB
LENRKKVTSNSLRSALTRKNKIEEGGALSSKMKREKESTDLRA